MSVPRRGRATRRRQPAPAALTLALVAAWLLTPALAQAESYTEMCQDAAAEAERDWGLPNGMLAAIGRVESGRMMQHGGSPAWPWTINAAGRGQHFTNKQDAMFTVARLQGAGIRSIDVGCFQINLSYHPGAFASLDEAFDPRQNALYAARFLSDLYQRNGSWNEAIGAYHSASAAKATAYRSRVLAAWRSAPAQIGSASTVVPQGAPLPVIHAGPPPMASSAPLAGTLMDNAVVWQASIQAMGMRVWIAAPPVRDPVVSSSPQVNPQILASHSTKLR